MNHENERNAAGFGYFSHFPLNFYFCNDLNTLLPLFHYDSCLKQYLKWDIIDALHLLLDEEKHRGPLSVLFYVLSQHDISSVLVRVTLV